jgi:hypothetical protein
MAPLSSWKPALIAVSLGDTTDSADTSRETLALLPLPLLRPPSRQEKRFYRPGTLSVTVAPVFRGVPGAGDWAVTSRESSPIRESSLNAMP